MKDDRIRILVWGLLATAAAWALPETRRPKVPVPFEKQVADLAACGIRFAAGVSPDSVFVSFDRQAFENDPYRLLLNVMGQEPETEAQAWPDGRASDNVWSLDMECIEDTGDYAAIARRLSILAQGELPLEKISDHVDVEKGEASLSFRLSGKDYRWKARVDDDWLDPTILSRFVVLLQERNAGRRFTSIDHADVDGDQTMLIGCATASERAALEKVSGMKVAWLK